MALLPRNGVVVKHFSPSLVVACVAPFFSLSGTATAAAPYPVTVIRTVTYPGLPGSCHGHSQTVTVLNDANVSSATLTRVEHAITIQSAQLRRYWHTPCVMFGPSGWPLKLTKRTDCVQVTPHRCLFGGVFGYHNGKPESPPWTTRFYPTWGEAETNTGGLQPWSVDLSHEVLEMLSNPPGLKTYANQPLEVCDAVESVWYRLRGVWVTDFVTPAWFHDARPHPPGTRFDQANRVHAAGDAYLS
jgi:hypothetical protein